MSACGGDENCCGSGHDMVGLMVLVLFGLCGWRDGGNVAIVSGTSSRGTFVTSSQKGRSMYFLEGNAR